MIYYHEWKGEDPYEYNEVEHVIGKTFIKPVASITWKTNLVRVYDENKEGWVLVRPGDYIIKRDDGKIQVTSG